jgi:hypothetical protein
MKASKDWGPCACNCGESIRQDAEFVIVEGAMYLCGHEMGNPAIANPEKAAEAVQLSLFDGAGDGHHR